MPDAFLREVIDAWYSTAQPPPRIGGHTEKQ